MLGKLSLDKGELTERGYICKGSVECQSDISANAAVIGTANLLLKGLEDGQSVISHLSANTDLVRQELSSFSISYDKLRSQLLSAALPDVPENTDGRLKQVYFPIADGQYHLLSLMSSSSLLFSIKQKIRHMEEERFEARKSNEGSYEQIHGLTCVGFGGTKPQNISVLNAMNRGQVYLLPCMPPELSADKARKPHRDFFSETLRAQSWRDQFERLQKKFLLDRNNIEIRQRIGETLEDIIEEVLRYALILKQLQGGWSDAAGYALPMEQKIWLDAAYLEKKETDTDWMKVVAARMGDWICRNYDYYIKEQHITFGDAELVYFRKVAAEVLAESEGLL